MVLPKEDHTNWFSGAKWSAPKTDTANIIRTQQIIFRNIHIYTYMHTYTYVYLYIYLHIQTHIWYHLLKKETMNMKESRERYMGKFGWRKEKEEM